MKFIPKKQSGGGLVDRYWRGSQYNLQTPIKPKVSFPIVQPTTQAAVQPQIISGKSAPTRITMGVTPNVGPPKPAGLTPSLANRPLLLETMFSANNPVLKNWETAPAPAPAPVQWRMPIQGQVPSGTIAANLAAQTPAPQIPQPIKTVAKSGNNSGAKSGNKSVSKPASKSTTIQPTKPNVSARADYYTAPSRNDDQRATNIHRPYDDAKQLRDTKPVINKPAASTPTPGKPTTPHGIDSKIAGPPTNTPKKEVVKGQGKTTPTTSKTQLIPKSGAGRSGGAKSTTTQGRSGTSKAAVRPKLAPKADSRVKSDRMNRQY